MKNKYNHPLNHWHFEVSSKCSLACPRCPRTEFPGQYKVTELDLDFFKNTFSEEFIIEEMDHLLFCGGQGDPIYCKDFLNILRYFKSVKPNIMIDITTNGSYKTEKWWEELASILTEYDQITFSVDGWDDESNNLHRVNSHFDSICKGIRIMSESKAVVNWSMILFKFNQDNIDKIENLARSLGINYFSIVESMLFGSYFNGYNDPNLGYDPLEPDKDFISRTYGRHFRRHKTLKEKIRATNNSFAKKKDLHKFWLEQSKDLTVLPLCMTSNRGKYIDAEGIFYPCSWTSHPFKSKRGKISNRTMLWEDSLWVQHKDRFDLKARPLEDVLNDPIWEKLFNSWKDKDKCFLECENKCSFKDDYISHSIKD